MAKDAWRAELGEAFLEVWKQALLERKKQVTLNGIPYGVRQAAKHRFLQIDFEVDGQPFRGLEQNPKTNSRWAQLARKGAKVMQFLSAGRYVAVVVDGKITTYS